MIDSKISRVRMRDLARLGRSRTASAANGRSAGTSASHGEPVTVTSSSGTGLAARPRAASPRPAGGDLLESIIYPASYARFWRSHRSTSANGWPLRAA
jgi:hypothetical protein